MKRSGHVNRYSAYLEGEARPTIEGINTAEICPQQTLYISKSRDDYGLGKSR